MNQPAPAAPAISLSVADESATQSLAAAAAALARPGDVIALSGELGTGKTAFARGFIRALTNPDEEVPSPTFTLVQTYDSPAGTIYHFDLYRLNAPEEAYELGIEEAFADGMSLIEWPDRLGPLLPADRLDVLIEYGAGPEARRVTFGGSPSWMARLKEARLG
ncbi:MAG: tRNA (adenosine(37)-N6)-threonylcarbamoyltransferase complex ATPase subunit type 1 TsaE [Rhodospirillales bacterium]